MEADLQDEDLLRRFAEINVIDKRPLTLSGNFIPWDVTLIAF